MDTIFTLGYEEGNGKMNLDELYEKKQKHDLNTLNNYNKILNRIHTKIKNVSKQKITIQFCLYVSPEIIIGVPKYNHGACTAYIIDKLNSNGFMTRYTHPNLLFISWKHWVPSYVRNEIKKKTGLSIDGYGNKINQAEQTKTMELSNPNELLMHNPKISSIIAPQKNKEFKSINSYTPTGNLIYNTALFKGIEERSNK